MAKCEINGRFCGRISRTTLVNAQENGLWPFTVKDKLERVSKCPSGKFMDVSVRE
ncbi:hypothetical protein ACMGE7_10070 [Macrococcus equi]|uniref:hypothetical protein n=1 Tax=Macrococcus equi TaxID=3395462 RepID=UPI0039BDCE1C